MYPSPSIHLELAKQRHHDVIAEARRYQLPKHLDADLDGSQRLHAVKGVFAGLLAAVTNLTRSKAAAQKPAATTC
jgi:hypothetical protein